MTITQLAKTIANKDIDGWTMEELMELKNNPPRHKGECSFSLHWVKIMLQGKLGDAQARELYPELFI